MNLFEYKWHGVINVGLPNLGILTCCKDLCTTTRRLCFAQLLEKQMVHRIRNYSSQVDFWLLYPVGLSPIRPIWRLKKHAPICFPWSPRAPWEKQRERRTVFWKWSVSRLLKSNVLEFILDLSIVLQLFTAFGIFLSLSSLNGAPTNACQILHKEGAW